MMHRFRLFSRRGASLILLLLSSVSAEANFSGPFLVDDSTFCSCLVVEFIQDKGRRFRRKFVRCSSVFSVLPILSPLCPGSLSGSGAVC